MKTYLVVGLGVSGQSVVDVLRAQGMRVETADDKKPADYTLADLAREDCDYSSFDCIITSPGFKPTTDFVLRAGQAGVPVISDVELAWQMHNSMDMAEHQQWIGITGTNGKTTTTEMTEAIMRAAGRKSAAVGNIGNAIVPAIASQSLDTIVAELSSFQLHYTHSVELECAAITNLADDHLDWHGGFEQYAADKAKIYAGVRTAMIYNADDARVTTLAENAYAQRKVVSCQLIGFTLNKPLPGQIGVEDGWILNRSSLDTPDEKLAPVASFTHLTEPDGSVYPHLLADALCALCLSLAAGAPVDEALKALQSFAPSGHRIQTVATAHTGNGDIRFVDDSKATNAHAAAASLSSYAPHCVVWIAGGLAKGAEFDSLVRNHHDVMKAAVIIGRNQQPMLQAFKQYAPQIPLTVIDPDSAETTPIMQQAVEAAAQYAQPGDVVLMAPACASMDQFVSYADRGEQFAHYAQEWVSGHGE